MEKKLAWRMGLINGSMLIMGCLLVMVVFWGGVEELATRWDKQEEYSHGYLIPFLTLYFIWQKKDSLTVSRFFPSWWGVLVVLLALVVGFVGEISALYILIHYALIAIFMGLALSLMGWPAVKPVLVPIALLIFAIPIPYFIEAGLSANLQLLSTRMGVAFIRACQIPVYMEGNIIDLGVFRLQVVEACSGLRYLFPLMSLGFICGFLFKAPLWKRAIVFFSTIPITIIMNSFRIGMIGVLVDNYGSSMAEGFIHDFEGWIVFMACMGVLLLEILLLTKIGKDAKPFSEVFGLYIEELDLSTGYTVTERPFSKPLAAVLLSLLVATGVAFSIQKRQEILPPRTEFAGFPMQLGGWQGSKSTLEDNVLEALGLTDYIMADYKTDKDEVVNFYSAYYASQRKGNSPHSPRVCIPGGGWKITEIKEVLFNGFPVNRIIVKKGDDTQLVYYWFQQRGKKVANEYLVKWYLFNDALFLNRTDGALVRLTTVLKPNETIEDAERRIQDFTSIVLPELPKYIPN
ncbi:VPLPA-CTERM-specific exosortase XrtD [Methylosoma difficile]